VDLVAWIVLVGAMLVFLAIDLEFFARGREPRFREAVVWSIGWLALSLLAAVPLVLLADTDDAVVYTTVYLIERSLSLDNLFVFLILFAYFGVPQPYRARMLFWGIVAALVLRGAAIAGGITLINEFHFVVYILGATLLLLAYRVAQGVDESVDPDRNLMVRAVRRLFPVDTEHEGSKWFTRVGDRRHVTPLFLCIAAIVFADLAFAIDSIPAAFAITREPFLIFMGNVFALLGLRALFVLVEGLVVRFRYLDETIGIVLALVGVKLLLEDVVKIGPGVSLGVVAFLLTAGIVASLLADRRDPRSEEKRRERAERVRDPTPDDDEPQLREVEDQPEHRVESQ
jgi:tellurite resistance protein TerC